MRCVCGFEGDGIEYAQHLLVCEEKPGSRWDFHITHNTDKPVNSGPISDVLEEE